MSRQFWPGWQLPAGTWPYSVQDLLQPALPLSGPRDDFGPRDSPASARPPGGGLLAILAEQSAAWDPSTSGLLGTARPAANSDYFGSSTPPGDWSSSAPHWLQTAMPFGLDFGLSSWADPRPQATPLAWNAMPLANLATLPPGNANPSVPFWVQTVLPPEANTGLPGLSPPSGEEPTDVPPQQTSAEVWDRPALPMPSAPPMALPPTPPNGSRNEGAPSSWQILAGSDGELPAPPPVSSLASLEARNVLPLEPAAPDDRRRTSDAMIGSAAQLPGAAAPMPEGLPRSEMWSDFPVGAGYPLSTKQSIEPQSDRRIVSDVTSDNDWMPGARYANKGQTPQRPRGPIQIGDRLFEPEPGQAIRLSMAEGRAQAAIARVRELDPSWRPRPSAYESIEGLIRAHESEAEQAQARLRELARLQFSPGIPSEKQPSDLRWSDTAREIARRFVENHRHVVEGASWLFELEPSIEAYLDPPKSLEELRQAVSDPKKGYDIHHIVEKISAEQDGFPTSMIHGPENLVRIPRFKHWEISSWYMTKSWAFGDLSPRDYLRGRDWAERMRVGLGALVRHGVVKP
jgi:hypothetical protein